MVLIKASELRYIKGLVIDALKEAQISYTTANAMTWSITHKKDVNKLLATKLHEIAEIVLHLQEE